MSDLADWGQEAENAAAEALGHHENWQQPRTRTWTCACGFDSVTKIGMDAHVTRFVLAAASEAFLGLPLQERARLARLPELVEREEWTIVWDDAGRSGGYPSRAVAEAAASRYDQTALAELPWHLESRTWFDTPPTPWAASVPALPADGDVQDVREDNK